MSVSIPFESLSDEIKQYLKSTCQLKEKASGYKRDRALHKAYKIDRENKVVNAPFYLWKEIFDEFPNDITPDINVMYKTKLLTKETDPMGRNRDQDVVAAEGLKKLKKDRCVFFALHTGFGKTRTAIYCFTKLKKKALILCHLSDLHEQWKKEIENNTDAKVQIITGDKPIDPDADVYIMGIIKGKKYTMKDFPIPPGLVVIDEAHLVTISAFTDTLLNFQPEFLIGLSATPDRTDGMHDIFQLYFGPSKTFIFRKETKSFTVIKYNTPFVPFLDYTRVNGRIVTDWGKILASIEGSEERQQYIVDRIKKYPNECILVLCNRLCNTLGIYEKIKEFEPKTDYYCSKHQKWDKSSRILVAGIKKGGTGMDHPFTMLVMASDVKDVRQYEGRIRKTDNVILDFVDDNPSCEKHWKLREDWYINKGGTIIEEYDDSERIELEDLSGNSE